jgi:hypothetical protein
LAYSLLVITANAMRLLLRIEGCGLISRWRGGPTGCSFTDEGRRLFAEAVLVHEELSSSGSTYSHERNIKRCTSYPDTARFALYRGRVEPNGRFLGQPLAKTREE